MKLALAGDTMLGRGVAQRLETEPPESLFAEELVDVVHQADLCLLNLECCISARGEPAPGKVFHFRAPPWATQALTHLGVDCVTLANNHALDFGQDALLDTLAHLDAAGIQAVGAGSDLERARAPAVFEANGFRLAVLAVTDHPPDYAAGPELPGVAYADLRRDAAPEWLSQRIAAVDADAVLVTPHWGPNMVAEPRPHVHRAATALVDAGATLVAGLPRRPCRRWAGGGPAQARIRAHAPRGGRGRGLDQAPLRRGLRQARHGRSGRGRPPRGPLALTLALLLFDPDGARGRREDRRVAVVPADAQTWRLIVEDLLHNAPPRCLRDALRLHHDPVSRMRFHCSTSLPSDSTSASIRAKGASERRVILRHGLRVAITPIVTLFGIDLGYLLGGAIIVEKVFNLQGVGQLGIDSLSTNDFPAVMGVTVMAAVFIIVANLIVDVMYAFLDPRIRYS